MDNERIERMMAELRAAIPGQEQRYYSVPLASGKRLVPVEVHQEVGSVGMWQEVEIADNYAVWLDTGYGRLALFRDEKLLERGKFNIITPDVVVLDRMYYGTIKYIWR